MSTLDIENEPEEEEETVTPEEDESEEVEEEVDSTEEDESEEDDDVSIQEVKDLMKELKNAGITSADIAAIIKGESPTATGDNDAAQARLVITLSNDWDVSPKEVERRMPLVYEEWKKLSKAEQKQMDTIEGAKILWDRIEKRTVAGAVGKGRRVSQTGSTNSKYWYTEDQIQNMSETELKKQDKRITQAYAEGRVKGA